MKCHERTTEDTPTTEIALTFPMTRDDLATLNRTAQLMHGISALIGQADAEAARNARTLAEKIFQLAVRAHVAWAKDGCGQKDGE